ncbi:transglutaminase domain-containing protein [Fulvivirga sp. 29W222]|uniref:Transglutaminase domain-containing protein n=1 Tax=Fulvivirga marina TaxID=2494733 RepID=A0A937FYF6_9BACT|nr:transglutaminase-like domain-containing protein [Fulvivirga marina]MBL6448435.1 transglutaminase domain-containing protein [Fulvivirga marina]
MVRFSLFLFLLSFQVNAQKIDDQLLIEARNLNKAYPDAEVAALSSRSVYDFFIDKRVGFLNASHEENIRYLALRSNTSFVKRNYYNDKSSIESYSLKSDRGKNYDHDKACGHFRSGDIFYSDAMICAYRFVMSLQGQGVDFESKTVYSDPRYLTKIFFHDDIPVVQREVIIKVPDWAEVELVEMNFDGYDIKKSVTKGEVTTYTYLISNVDTLSDDDNAPGSLLYLPHILLLTKSYVYNASKVSVLASTDDLYDWYYTLISQLGHNTTDIDKKVKELTLGLSTDKERIEAIYYWVQDNIKYIAFENGLAAFKPEEADKVFYNRYGDCKGMANLTKTMLRLAGFDARLSWIGTNKIPYTYDIPSLAVDNHMICTVYLPNKQYILDPTEKYNPLGQHAERIQGKQILIENGTAYEIDTVAVERIENYLNESRLTFNVSDNQLAGTGLSNIHGEYKKDLFNYIHALSKEDIGKFLQAIVSGSSNPDNFNIEEYSELDRNTPLTITYGIRLDNHINTFDDEMYLDLDFKKEFKDLKLDDDRDIPYDFGRKAFSRTIAEITLPKGYKINYMPEPYHVQNDYFEFDMKYEMVKGKIIYTKEIKLLQNTLPVSAFGEWNTTVNNINKFYNDQIILKADD